MVKDQAIANHYRLLGHESFGVTELRIFDPVPMVAYADNECDFLGLCLEMDGRTRGIYVGVQPHLLDFFDFAPNRWVPARSKSHSNCASDKDIEYITTCFWDLDVVSEERSKGHPASEEELQQSSKAAELMSRQDGLALTSVILCSGNGHYVLSPIVPILVDSAEIARQFKQFCHQIAGTIASNVRGIKIDPVYNLSRVMRLIGTINGKGQPVPGRSHRRAHFVTEPIFAKSMALHYMILNTEIEQNTPSDSEKELPQAIKCNLSKIEKCYFIQYCRTHPELVSEPQWWGLITNLARLKGGRALIHEISRLDQVRYDYGNTERVIKRVLDSEYRPMSCQTLMSSAITGNGRGRFTCPEIRRCPARAPMYTTSIRVIHND